MFDVRMFANVRMFAFSMFECSTIVTCSNVHMFANAHGFKCSIVRMFAKIKKTRLFDCAFVRMFVCSNSECLNVRMISW